MAIPAAEWAGGYDDLCVVKLNRFQGKIIIDIPMLRHIGSLRRGSATAVQLMRIPKDCPRNMYMSLGDCHMKFPNRKNEGVK